jgi:hypothetical protein
MNDWQDYEDTEINHESFVFFESFYIAMKSLTLEEKKEYISSICNYALYEKTFELSPKIEGMFQLVKPQIDANIKKRKNGKKGGRPPNEKP